MKTVSKPRGNVIQISVFIKLFCLRLYISVNSLSVNLGRFPGFNQY